MESYLKEGERLDDLQLKGLHIIQDPKRFCFGIDAVLISSYARVNPGEQVLDLCCGNGAIALLLAGKCEARRICGLEIQEDSADMARRSAALNGLEDLVKITTGDLKRAADIYPAASYDVIVSNPPYMAGNDGKTSSAGAKAIARHEILCNFDDVAAAVRKLLVPGGRFYLVHRPYRLVDIFASLREHRIEPKRMKLVQPFEGKEPTMVLLECVRGGKPQLTVEPPLIVYKEPGVYTEELLRYYHG